MIELPALLASAAGVATFRGLRALWRRWRGPRVEVVSVTARCSGCGDELTAEQVRSRSHICAPSRGGVSGVPAPREEP